MAHAASQARLLVQQRQIELRERREAAVIGWRNPSAVCRDEPLFRQIEKRIEAESGG